MPESGICRSEWPQSKTKRNREEKLSTKSLLEDWKKKLWSMNATEIPVVIDSLCTVTKWLIQVLEKLETDRRVEITQIIALLKSTRILRRVLENWGDLLWLKFQWKYISYLLEIETL